MFPDSSAGKSLNDMSGGVLVRGAYVCFFAFDSKFFFIISFKINLNLQTFSD